MNVTEYKKEDDLLQNYVIKQPPISYTVKIVDGKPTIVQDECTEFLSPEEDDLRIRWCELQEHMNKMLKISSDIRLYKGVAFDFYVTPIGFQSYKSKTCDELGNCGKLESAKQY